MGAARCCRRWWRGLSHVDGWVAGRRLSGRRRVSGGRRRLRRCVARRWRGRLLGARRLGRCVTRRSGWRWRRWRRLSRSRWRRWWRRWRRWRRLSPRELREERYRQARPDQSGAHAEHAGPSIRRGAPGVKQRRTTALRRRVQSPSGSARASPLSVGFERSRRWTQPGLQPFAQKTTQRCRLRALGGGGSPAARDELCARRGGAHDGVIDQRLALGEARLHAQTARALALGGHGAEFAPAFSIGLSVAVDERHVRILSVIAG